MEAVDWILEMNFERYKRFALGARGLVSEEELREIRHFLRRWLKHDRQNGK